MTSRGTLLITGFGPFPGMPENESARLVPKLANLAARRFSAHRVISRVLPTEWERAPQKLAALYTREKPKVVLHFGVSDRAHEFVIETVARNKQSLTPDALGAVPPSTRILNGGPKTVASTIPSDEIVKRLRALGVKAKLSDDAGAFLCNAVLYRSLLMAETLDAGVLAGFVHIPHVIAAPQLKPRAAKADIFDWDIALTGGLEIIRTCLGRPPSRRR